jgi:NADH/NAD ratio-sensing transcriptional regulator Rex
MHPSNDTPQGIGKVLSNLQALEFALRLFLYELQKTDSNQQTQSFDLQSLSVGEWVPETPLTNYDTLGQLINKVNAELQNRGSSDQVDLSVVELRDAIAHGRVLSLRQEGPFSILKFSKPLNGKVQVAVAVEMTPGWFKQQIKHTRAEVDKVVRIARGLGLTCFPD